MVAVLAGGIGGAIMLRRAWRGSPPRTLWRLAGWSTLALSLGLPAVSLGEARGPFIALALLPLAVLAVVAVERERRTSRSARKGRSSLAPEPAERASSYGKSTLRWLLAGPVGMIAAIGVGICFTVWAPGAAQTRLVIGGLIVPIAWGACMAWTLADSRVLRATAVLTATALLSFGAAMLRGFS